MSERKPISVYAETYQRIAKIRFAMMRDLGRELSFSEVLDALMDAAGWPKTGK